MCGWSRLAAASASTRNRADLGRGGELAGQDHLQGDDAVQADLPGLVDDAHAAAGDLAPASRSRRSTAGRPRPLGRPDCAVVPSRLGPALRSRPRNLDDLPPADGTVGRRPGRSTTRIRQAGQTPPGALGRHGLAADRARRGFGHGVRSIRWQWATRRPQPSLQQTVSKFTQAFVFFDLISLLLPRRRASSPVRDHVPPGMSGEQRRSPLREIRPPARPPRIRPHPAHVANRPRISSSNLARVLPRSRPLGCGRRSRNRFLAAAGGPRPARPPRSCPACPAISAYGRRRRVAAQAGPQRLVESSLPRVVELAAGLRRRPPAVSSPIAASKIASGVSRVPGSARSALGVVACPGGRGPPSAVASGRARSCSLARKRWQTASRNGAEPPLAPVGARR